MPSREDLLKLDKEFHKRNDEAFLPSAPDDLKELFLKCKAVSQPYIDRMNTDPLNYAQAIALDAEMMEKIGAIMWEYQLRQDATR